MAHEEIDFLDEIERTLVALTTARLVEKRPQQTAVSSFTYARKTVILAQARTHTT